MSEHPNVELMRSTYAAFKARDMDTMKERLSPDIVWHVAGDNPRSGTYKGVDEVLGFLAGIGQDSNGTFNLEVHDVLANDDHMIALLYATAERNGKKWAQNVVHVMHANPEGRVTEFWGIPSDQKATDAFWSD